MGTCVQVYFDDGLWYKGKIVTKRSAKGKYEVLFDDGVYVHIVIIIPITHINYWQKKKNHLLYRCSLMTAKSRA